MGGDAMDRGLVLTLSIWDDGATEMRWLDSNFPTTEDPTSRYGVARGPCSSSDSSPLNLRSKYPGASVSYTNIKVGSIGSTFSATRRLDVHVRIQRGPPADGSADGWYSPRAFFQYPCKSWNSQPRCCFVLGGGFG